MYTNKVDIFSVGMIWMVMSVPELLDIDELLYFWIDILSPVDPGYLGLSRTDVYNTLRRRYPTRMTMEMMLVVSSVICRPERRVDIDGFIQGVSRLPQVAS